jgi:PEP-CTERM motif
MFKKLALASAFVLCMTILSSTAWADTIPILNPSFETLGGPLTATCGPGCAFNYGPVPGIPGWTSSDGGSWQPGSYFSSIPDGSIVAFTNAQSSLTQTLTGISVLSNSLYTFNIYVGDRTDGINGNYNLSLDTILGGVTTTLCSISGNAANIQRGTFQLQSCTYMSGSSVPAGNLFLQLSALSGQLDVDNLSLTVQPPATSVPEPSSMLLLSVGIMFLLATFAARRKQKLQFTA